MKGKIPLIVLCILIVIFFLFNINCFNSGGVDCSIQGQLVIDLVYIYYFVFIMILLSLIWFILSDLKNNLIKLGYYVIIGIISLVGVYIEEIFIKNIFGGQFKFLVHSTIILILVIILILGVNELKKEVERRLR